VRDVSLLRWRLHTPTFAGTEHDFDGMDTNKMMKSEKDLDEFMAVMRRFAHTNVFRDKVKELDGD
jgi:hypothetical protein